MAYDKANVKCIDCPTGSGKPKPPQPGKTVENSSDTLVKLLIVQLKNDSLFIEKQDEINRQNRELIENISRLVMTIKTRDSIHQINLSEERKEIPVQQEDIQESIDEISKNVEIIKKTMSTTDEKVVKDEPAEKWKPKPIAFGIDVAGMFLYNPAQDNYKAYSPSVVFLSIIPQRNFKIEAEVAGVYSSTGDNDFFASVGLYGMWQGTKTNFYSGVKGMRFFNLKSNFIIPTIGGEYVFGRRFSLGAEIGIPMCFDKGDFSIGLGFNRMILRFYLGGKDNGKKEKT